MKIRKANQQDLQQISKLFWESDNYHYNNQPNIYSETEKPFRKIEYLEEFIEDEKNMLYVLEMKDKIVGFIYGYEESKGFLPIHKKRTYFYIDNVVISNKHQRNGYGRMLMDKIINKCKERNYTDIILNVYSFNKKAISLYENLGFEDLAKDMILEL